MKIYVYGAGTIGAKIEDSMNEYGLDLEGYLDSHKIGEFKGKKIYSLTDISPKDSVIISVLNTNSILDIFQLLKKAGIRNVYWYYDAFQDRSPNNNFFKDQCLDMSDWSTNVMPHIELHISDMCNLNCRGCTHFSPLFNEISAVLDQKMEDVRKIKRLFEEVFRIDILGGEPLLNPDLKEYVVKLREELPKTFIQIYTNGILIPKLEDDVLQAIHDANVGISISEYLPTHNMIGQILDKLDKFNIRYHIAAYDSKQMFNKPISLSNNSKYPFMCISDGCITVSGGRIARCPTLMYISKFNEYFGKNLPTDGIYEIDSFKNGNELLEDMRKEIPLCKHCIKCDMDWSVCEKTISIEDFAVNE